MNSLSWLIYAGNVVDGLGTLLACVFFIGLAGCIMGLVISGAEGEQEIFKKVLKYTFGLMAFGVVICFVPNKETIYMIAASEAGQKVVSTPEAKEMLGDLQQAISKQIKKLKDGK